MSFLLYEICVDVCACRHSWVAVYVSAFVFMLQWGVKLIWEPELLNLLLKLVFDRKLISKAREEEVEEGEKRKRGKKWKWDLCLLRQWLQLWLLCLDWTCFRWMNHDTSIQGIVICFFGEEPTKKPFSTLVVVARRLFFIFLSLLEKSELHVEAQCFE